MRGSARESGSCLMLNNRQSAGNEPGRRRNGMQALSAQQLEAVRHMDGPAMVLAGPGSGKTTVITRRVQYLIENHIRPEHILVITFTRAAARQMQERFSSLSGGASSLVTFGTFHAIFFQILKHAYGYTSESILREDERFRIIADIAGSMGLECGDLKEWAADVLSEISVVKTRQIPIEHYYSSSMSEEEFRKVCSAYMKRQEALRKIDFDDMCVYTSDLFHSRQDILRAWQERFRYLLVDEFQDISPIQYRIVRQLAGARNNLFIVGDDDQSIYRFRGSRPEIMLGFPSDYPDARIIQLRDNYRSTAAIVSASLAVISENKKRYRKDLRSVDTSNEPIEFIECADMETEMLCLVRAIQRSLAGGLKPSDIAVLTRTNTEGREPSLRLAEFQIPCRMKDAVPVLWDHWIAEDLTAYLALDPNAMNRKDFLRVCNRPNRYITRKSAYAQTVSFHGLRAYYRDKDWMAPYLDSFEELIRRVRSMRPYAAINYIRLGGGYDEYLADYARKRKLDPGELLQLADEIQDSSRGCATLAEWLSRIEENRKKIADQKRDAQRPDSDCVTLATLHAAKGLEFAEVFLLNVNEGLIPYHRASLEEEIEEERRLFYVGMTRAKRKLHLFCVRERYNRQVEPSRFLKPLRIVEKAGDKSGKR